MGDRDVGGPGSTVAGALPSDDELVVLALAAGPRTVPAEDAVPMADYLGQDVGLLPDWYMPTPTTRVRARWRLPVVLALVAVFLVLEGLGLCSTFGHVVPG